MFSLILLYTPQTYNGLVKCLHYIHLNMGLQRTTKTLLGKTESDTSVFLPKTNIVKISFTFYRFFS